MDMKKIINGKKFDTDTATKFYEGFVNGVSITYYRKKNEEFFFVLAGKIVPESRREAAIYLEDHLSVEQYENVFGEAEE